MFCFPITAGKCIKSLKNLEVSLRKYVKELHFYYLTGKSSVMKPVFDKYEGRKPKFDLLLLGVLRKLFLKSLYEAELKPKVLRSI